MRARNKYNVIISYGFTDIITKIPGVIDCTDVINTSGECNIIVTKEHYVGDYVIISFEDISNQLGQNITIESATGDFAFSISPDKKKIYTREYFTGIKQLVIKLSNGCTLTINLVGKSLRVM